MLTKEQIRPEVDSRATSEEDETLKLSRFFSPLQTSNCLFRVQLVTVQRLTKKKEIFKVSRVVNENSATLNNRLPLTHPTVQHTKKAATELDSDEISPSTAATTSIHTRANNTGALYQNFFFLL